MGRLDDALRRSGEPTTFAPDVRSDGEAFVSPWSLSASNGARPVEASRPGSQLFEGSPAGAPRGFNVDRPDLVAVSNAVDPALSHQFRRLAASLHNARDEAKLKVVMVTSTAPGEGKTLTAMNLAVILSASHGSSVLLIDADLRRPSLHRVLGLAERRGLSDGLRAPAEHRLPVVQLSDRLTLLPAGRPDPDPTSGLASERMHHILEEARARFDWVILDTPPITSVADASLLLPTVDAVLLVVRAGTAPSAMVRKAVEAIRDRIFGVVLNGVDAKESLEAGYLYSYGRERQQGN